MEQKQNIMQLMQTASPSQLIQSAQVADRFKNLYQVIHGRKNGEQIYETEKFHFLKLLQENQTIAACTKLSLYGCFLDVAVNGLSFDPGMKHLYLVPYNVNAGTKENPKWEKRAQLQISGYGELALRQRFGQIKHADNPILVYEGDHFAHGTKDGKVYLEHVATFPRKSENIMACYIAITRNDGTNDYKVLSIEEVMKLRKFSKDPNSKAWTDGLPGMVQAKTIKHAFKSYPKVRVGEFSSLASDTVDEEIELIPGASQMPAVIDYGTQELPEPSGTYAPTMIISPAQQEQQPQQQQNSEHFAPQQAQPSTVQVEDDNDIF